MTQRRFPWIPFALAGSAVAILWSFRSPESGSPPQDAGTPEGAVPSEERQDTGQGTRLTVEAAPVEAADGYRVLRRYSGMLRAARRQVLGFEVPGRVIEVHVDEGATVAEGDPIATLDGARLLASRSELAAGLEAAQAKLEEALAGPRPETITAARAQVAALQADLDLAGKRLVRRRELQAQAAASDEDVDAAIGTQATLQATLDGAQARLAELEAGTRKEQVAAARASVAQIDASLTRLDLDIEDLVLRAPFAGTIQARNVNEGAIVTLGQAAVELVETGALEAWIGVPPEMQGQLQPEALRLTVADRSPSVLTLRTLPDLDLATRTIQVVLALDPEGAQGLLPGQLARLSLEREVPGEGFWVPTLALTQSVRGLWSCFLLPTESNRIRRAELEVLHVDGSRSFVRGTLQAGDRIVLAGPHRIVPGQEVVASEPAAPKAQR